MSLHFEQLENKIVLSSFGYHKPNLPKVHANIHDTHIEKTQDTHIEKTHLPLFVMSITPSGAIHCVATFGKVIQRGA